MAFQDTPMHTSVLRVAAYDRDIGQNSEVIYSLKDQSGFFSINNKTGWIYVKAAIYGVSLNSVELIRHNPILP